MNQEPLFSFNDVLIEPIFSNVRSRKDVDASTEFLNMKLSLPVVCSNMDTVSSPELCRALADYGTIGTLHRFWSIEQNVKAFVDSISPNSGYGPIVSIGIGDKEFERAKALYKVGAARFMLDVAHSANIAVVEMYNKLTKEFPLCNFIVGDFGTGQEIHEFLKRVDIKPDAVKVGISVGSVCVTRLTTGVGTPALSCLQDCADTLDDWSSFKDIKLVLDGGVKYYGDIAKALIAGADLVISGSMFAGTEEAPGEFVDNGSGKFKAYRGSASHESYVVQNKTANWRAPEGIATLIPYKGPVLKVLNEINGALKSSCSYVNAFNLNELKANGKFRFVK
jgi:IMP dehydrogenase